MKGDTLQIVFTWPDGREEIRYERYVHSESARELMAEVDEAQSRCDLIGEVCPYSYRFV